MSPDALLLVGARNRKETVAAFDRYLADPRVGVREWDLRVRALFTFVASEQTSRQPSAEGRQERFKNTLRQEAIRLIPAIASKNSEARKVSVDALATIEPEALRSAGLLPPENYGLSRDELIAHFVELPPEAQSELLSGKWDLVRGPEMIPVLATLVTQTKPKGSAEDAIRLQALRKLADVSPAEATRIMRNEIGGGKQRYAAFAERDFPAQDIPEADAALSTMLKDEVAKALPFVAKFATAKLERQMRGLYQSQSWPCTAEEWFLAYFLRTVPREGADFLRIAMANRENRGCYHSLLDHIAVVVWNSVIQAQAISTLDDPDPEAAISAARVLAARGGPEVEGRLWKRLGQWSEHWRGRAAELAVHPITGGAASGQSQLGSALYQAISSAQSWRLDEPRRDRLLALCIEDWCREQWGQERPSAAIRIDVSNGGAIYPAAFRLEAYTARTMEALKNKLLQFPAGTTFRWCPQVENPADDFSPGQREVMFNELSAFLSNRSMSIEPYTQDKCLPGQW